MQAQAKADAGYFVAIAGRKFTADEAASIADAFLRAYRYQYIVSGVQDERFNKILGGMINAAQGADRQGAGADRRVTRSPVVAPGAAIAVVARGPICRLR